MNLLNQYTSYQEVRATLGVSSTELTDATLALPVYATLLDIDLEGVSPSVVVQFDRISAITAPGAPTAAESKFLATVRLFAAYAVSRHLMVSLPMFSVQKLEDGKAHFIRFNEAYSDLKDGLDAMYISLRYRLGVLLQQIDPTSGGVPAYEGGVTSVTAPLAIDPVTAET